MKKITSFSESIFFVAAQHFNFFIFFLGGGGEILFDCFSEMFTIGVGAWSLVGVRRRHSLQPFGVCQKGHGVSNAALTSGRPSLCAVH